MNDPPKLVYRSTNYGMGKRTFKRIVDDAINNGEVLYFDKKRSQALPLSASGSNTLNSLSIHDFKKNVSAFKKSVKNKRPKNQDEVRRAKEEVLKQTIERV